MAKDKNYKIIIKVENCKACKLCYDHCPTNAIKGNEETGIVEINDEDKCIGCLKCENICPDFAIEIEDKN